MERLPENVQSVFEGILEDLRSRESVVGIGLFGSWVRGDAVPVSDVDLLVIDSRDFDYEYVERAEIDGVFLDLDYVPEKWILKQFPPEIDQKLDEVEILYDRDGKFARAKSLMSKMRWTAERVEIRTGDYLMEADTYLSRGISALNKDDFQSAKVNAAIGLDAIMKLLVEVNKQPFSNSHFIRTLESSTRKFGTTNLFEDYLELTMPAKLNRQNTEKKLASVSDMWNETIGFVKASSPLVETLHVRVRNDLNYYCKESFLKGLQARAISLIKDGLYFEAMHYMFRASISMLENYVWLLSNLEGGRFDYTDLFRRMKSSRVSPEGVYENAVEAFELREITRREAEETLRRTKQIVLGIRRKRNELIAAVFS